MKWTYDEQVDAAYIAVDDREPVHVKTIDLAGIHVMVDVDGDGNVLGIELIGMKYQDLAGQDKALVGNLNLEKFLKQAPNGSKRKID